MEEQERSRSPSRAKRVEQAVGRWLRRSRDSISRERKSADGRCGGAGACGPQSTPIRVTVQILRDPQLASHGFSVSDQPPLQVRDVTSGGPADGKLVPGDQLLQINNITTDDLSPEQAAVIISEVPDSVTMTVLRQSSGPKSSFMTAEKRARLRSNPVKVRFAEEVVVNGHAQGNSLLFLPNVLKVYLENGQTKAFKFGASTTVKDILDTLKEKLSIRCIGFFALVLEQQSSTSRLLLLHEEEIIQKVVQKKDTRDYRCLLRVSFLPRDPLELLQCDPVAFEYLYLQSVSDVLRERFAVEMKCNTALCLAALHMQERLHSCGHMHKTSVKSITKEWGIENFISPTLLRNMKEKDLRKAISYHMKKTRSLLEPRQKVLSVVQARLNYLKQLSDLMSYGGKFFTATMMFQGRETVVNLLVGARYGISQVVNHKLNLLSPLIEFSSIGRVELMPESEKLSLVRIFAQDMKPVILLMEPVAAKDLSCVVSGYCKLEAERSQAVFLLANPPREHRISAEEGYESRGCSDSEESSEEEDDDEGPVEDLSKNEAAAGEEENLEKGEDDGGEEKMQTEEDPEICAAAEGPEDPSEMNRGGEGVNERRNEEQLDEKLFLELSDFCHTDARVDASFSSDSMEALIEDTIIPHRPGAVGNPQACHTGHAEESAETEQNAQPVATRPTAIDYDNNPSLCFAELSRMVNFLPSPPAASEEEEEQVGSACVPQEDHISIYEEIPPPCPNNGHPEGSSLDQPKTVNILKTGEQSQSPIHVPQPSTLFGDSSSDDEFFDAPDAPSVSAADRTSEKQPEGNTVRLQSLREGTKEEERTGKRRGGQQTSELEPSVKKCHKRQASIHKTDGPIVWEEMVCHYSDKPSDVWSCPGITSVSGSRKEPTEARSSPSSSSPSAGCFNGEAQELSSELVEIERVSMVVEPTKVRPSATSLSSPTVTHSTKTENCGMHSSNGERIEENHCTTAIADVRLNTTGGPITEKYDAAELEGSPGRRSLSGPHLPEQTGKGLCSAKITSSQTPSPSLHPHILRPNTSGPKTDWRNNSNKDVNQQDTPPPFRLDLRKRNSCFALLLRNGMSPSYENLLRSEMEALGVKDTSAIGGLGASAKQPMGLGLQGCSSTMGNRLSSSMIRCKIQTLPWYLSRPQEPHVATGNYKLDKSHNSSGSSESSQCITGITEVMRRDEKYPAKTSEVGNHSEEQANLPADSHLLEISRCGKNDDSLLFASSLDRKPEIHMQSNPSLDCQGPVTQFGVEETSNSGVDCFTESSNPKETCTSLQECESVQPHPLPQPWPHLCPGTSATAGCSSDSGLATKQPHLEACGCRTVYANCFSGDSDGSGFDEELTVHEFSRKTQGADGVHLTSPVLSSFSFPSSPDLPKDSLSLPATPDASRLLPFPESRNGDSATSPDEALTQLRTRRYRLPGGFTSLQRDVEELLALLQGVTSDLPGQDTGDTLFSDSGRLLHAEARRLMSGCQQVTRVGQTPDEMLQCLADGFRALVRLACSCLHSRGSSDSRAQALRVLQEIAGAYGEFARAAERVSGRETCQDLSIKLLARQCTSLTSSIFCLTQLFCTITSL